MRRMHKAFLSKRFLSHWYVFASFPVLGWIKTRRSWHNILISYIILAMQFQLTYANWTEILGSHPSFKRAINFVKCSHFPDYRTNTKTILSFAIKLNDGKCPPHDNHLLWFGASAPAPRTALYSVIDFIAGICNNVGAPTVWATIICEKKTTTITNKQLSLINNKNWR